MSVTLSPRIVVVVVCAALAAIALAGGTVAVILPQASQADSLQQKIAAVQAKIDSAATTQSATSDEAISKAATEVLQLSAAMPETTDMPGILMQLSSVASQSPVTINSIQPSALVPAAGGYSTLPFALVIDGKYAAITHFLALLRSDVNATSAGLAVHGRLFVVSSVSIGPGNGSSSATGGSTGAAGGSTPSNGGMLQASLQVDAFVYGTPTSTSATTTATTTTTSS